MGPIGELTVSLTTVVCLLILAIVPRYIIHVQLDFIPQYAPAWIYIAHMISREERRESKISNVPLLWSLAIIISTAAILLVYAI